MLLTDFGLSDPYVGIMKGVILSRAPKAQLVDLSHGVPPGDVRAAAFTLKVSVPFFPLGSLFVCVVDPGVGSKRRVLWARSARHQFLAPDNGLLSWLEGDDALVEVREVANESLYLPRVSKTFHGRDVFAPVAAKLGGTLSPVMLGPKADAWLKLPAPEAAQGRGEVLVVDRFGNAVTSLRPEQVRAGVRFKELDLGPLCTHYAEAPEGRPLALVGSSGYVELCLRDGDFARKTDARPGDPVHAY